MQPDAARPGRSSRPRPLGGRGSAALLVVGAVAVVAIVGVRRLSETGRHESAVPVVVVPAPPPPVSVYDTLGPGQTLGELLAANGVGPAAAMAVTETVRGYRSPRTLRPGLVARFTSEQGREPYRVLLQLTADSLLDLSRADSGWSALVREVPVTTDTIVIAGRIETSLWFAELSGETARLGEDEFPEYVFDLADVFAWKVDFTRDIRSGDGFRVAIERERRPDGSLRSRRFLAIEFRNRDRVLAAIPFTRPGGRREYFDVDGEALRGVFLRYPVPFRVTSGFARRRYHPVLKTNRPHLGIDYGAPHGTPVKATAAGTVVRAGTWGSFGRIVEIRHVKGIHTRYAHLSSISSGVRVGAFVDQGQVIGRVGSSGLATGPHLHYEFLQGGQHRNPSTVDLPSAERLEEEFLASFAAARDEALSLLDPVPLPDAAPARVVERAVAD